jgi:large conductance mechanosensitive channel
MLKEFKAFIMRGNLVEIAVGLVLALAFAAVVASFVSDIITPIIAAIFGQPDFSSLKIDIGETAITYGRFLNALISFLLVAFVMFLIVKAYNRMAGPKDATTRPCPYCKTDIALDATRCPNCTSQLEGVAA